MLVLVILGGVAALGSFIYGIVKYCAAENVDKGNIAVSNMNGGAIQVGNPLAVIAGGRSGDMQDNWVTRTDTANRQRKEARQAKAAKKQAKTDARDEKFEAKKEARAKKKAKKAKAKAKANGTYEADKARRKEERKAAREAEEEAEWTSGSNPMHEDDEPDF